MKNKFTSRKFLAMIAGILTGLGLILSGSVTEGTVAVVSAIVAYLVAEGYIDAKAVKTTLDGSQDVIEGVVDNVGGENND